MANTDVRPQPGPELGVPWTGQLMLLDLAVQLCSPPGFNTGQTLLNSKGEHKFQQWRWDFYRKWWIKYYYNPNVYIIMTSSWHSQA